MEWNQELLEKVCNFWVDKLHLQEWKVSIGFKRYWELPEDSSGQNVYERLHRISDISILDPQDFNLNVTSYTAYGVEEVIVHELVHIILYQWEGMLPDEKYADWEFETAINKITRILLEETSYFDSHRDEL